MKKSWRVTLIVAVVVLLGSIITGIITFNTYNRILKNSTMSIAELSAMNVYSEINNELIKPIYVSKTMAQDSFVKEWLAREDDSNQNEIIEYLDNLNDKYNYNSVFLVSADTLNYYHYNGLNKTISPSDSHDVWYYTFINQPEDYLLDVDVDEVTSVLTIFVNVKMFDQTGNLIAVVGVGVEMDYVENIISEFEEDFDLSVYLCNREGVIQSSTNISYIENKNILDDFSEDISANITSSNDDLLIQSTKKDSQYIITRYIDELDWYLLVTKNTNIFERFFLDYLYLSLLMLLTVLGIVSTIVFYTITRFQERIYTLAKTDYLTLLLNRRGFDNEMGNFDSEIKEALIFITDIDRFKIINDNYGHAEGDKVLRYLAKIIDSEVSHYGKLSRWGGDEFTAFMVGERSLLEDSLNMIFNTIREDAYLIEMNVSISLGFSYTDFSEDLYSVLARADKGLYEAKQAGGNCKKYIE